MTHSPSERNGIAALRPQDRSIYSVGISTAGAAEIHMALCNPQCKIIATTLDPTGATNTQTAIAARGLASQIDVKLEDVAAPLPYPDAAFDYIYARLVLHYLPKRALESALHELHRILHSNGQIFIVVRSTQCTDAQDRRAQFDPTTHLTTYSSQGHSYARYFHTEESINHHLHAAGFGTRYTRSYEEQLCVDFARQQPSAHTDVLIETLGYKER